MNNQLSYHKQLIKDNTVKLRKLLSELPPYITDYFRARDTTTSSKTKLSYAYDLRVFFNFLKANNPELSSVKIKDISCLVLDQLTPSDIEEFMEYLKYYEDPETNRQQINNVLGIARKLSSLRGLYNYLYKRQMIKNKVTDLVDMPKLHEKPIVRLDQEEITNLLDYMESCGENLTSHQKSYYKKTILRDLAIITLLLGTGIRVSECVGLDISDIDFRNDGFHITRKGGDESIIYFGPEVEIALLNYLEEREQIEPHTGHDNALFLSMQKKRISVDAVENLVKKYTSQITAKKITPHKLRSTYGTNLYQETNDIYLVADVLGHKDVNTTRKHYAAMQDSRRRVAAKVISLRENPIDE